MPKLPIPFSNPATYPGHSGVDFAQPRGTAFRASGAGVVTWLGSNSRGGNFIWVKYDAIGPKVGYHHMDSHNGCPREGARFNEGDVLGYVGNTGNSTGPHLHSEVEGYATTDGYWRFFDRDRVVGHPSAAGSSASPSSIQSEEDEDMKLIRWNSNHVFAVGREAIYHIPDVAQLGALEAVHGAAKDVDNTGLTSVLLANGIHWDAVDAVLRGLGNASGGKYWSRLTAEGVAIRGEQAAQSKTLADVLETAKSIRV